MKKEILLEKITRYYLDSGDYNGLPSTKLNSSEKEGLIDLLSNGKVFILTESNDVNIYINRLNAFESTDKQIESVQNNEFYTIYPAQSHLKTIQITENKPFSKMLAQGMEQLHILYFSVEVLIAYAAVPKYRFFDHGYSGTITLDLPDYDDFDPIHSDYIKHYGMAYPSNGPIDSDRAIAVFVRDLAHLNDRAQSKWYAYLLPDQEAFIVNSRFLNTLLLEDWSTEYWIFNALLDEINYINKICIAIGLPHLFKFDKDLTKELTMDDPRLSDYRILLEPTLKRYNEFVVILEKIVVQSLNYKFFEKDAPPIKAITTRDANNNKKGSITLLDEWIAANYYHECQDGIDSFKKCVTRSFRDLRNKRQAPAHEFTATEYKKEYYKQQNELVLEIYEALNSLRLIFSDHPRANNIPLPNSLADRNKIVLY